MILFGRKVEWQIGNGRQSLVVSGRVDTCFVRSENPGDRGSEPTTKD
jgi:hypothetical protein